MVGFLMDHREIINYILISKLYFLIFYFNFNFIKWYVYFYDGKGKKSNLTAPSPIYSKNICCRLRLYHFLDDCAIVIVLLLSLYSILLGKKTKKKLV